MAIDQRGRYRQQPEEETKRRVRHRCTLEETAGPPGSVSRRSFKYGLQYFEFVGAAADYGSVTGCYSLSDYHAISYGVRETRERGGVPMQCVKRAVTPALPFCPCVSPLPRRLFTRARYANETSRPKTHIFTVAA